jgi:hypothetical protein
MGRPPNRGNLNNVVLVFRDGVGYDSARLMEAVRGRVGVY